MSVLAVGERFNQARWSPALPENDLSFDLRRRMGFYNRGPRRAFLLSLGLRWDDGINLLWPSPVAGEWSSTEAARVAQAIRPQVEQYDWALLFGKRVCDAFGVPFEIGDATWFDPAAPAIYVPLPHPSGRCREWNDPNVCGLARQIAGAINEFESRNAAIIIDDLNEPATPAQLEAAQRWCTDAALVTVCRGAMGK